jgi:serine protease Do
VKLTESKPGDGATAEDRVALAGRVVVLERAGKGVGLGVVLNGDGRIATALSLLGDVRHLDAHYADGSLVPVRVGHADRAHDLALLVPQNAHHKLGLKATQNASSALNAPLASFVIAGTKAGAGATLTLRGPSSVNTNDGQPFPEALSFATPASATSVGGPLVNANGEVVAIVTRACEKKTGKGCTPVLVGTPVSIVREFLRTAPKTAALPAPSLGVEVASEDTGSARGLRVTAARGPAAVAGLRAGADARSADVIVAVDGVPVTTPEALAHQVEDRVVGDVVDVLVLGSGRYRHVTLTVAAPLH